MIWVLAFSIQDQIEKYGAYVALASFLGLALLSVLYFAQAREVRRLRDWAGRAPERDRELAERVSAQADLARRAPQPARQATVVRGPAAASEPVNGGGKPVAVPMGPRPATAAAVVAAAVSSAAAVQEESRDEGVAAPAQGDEGGTPEGAEPPAGGEQGTAPPAERADAEPAAGEAEDARAAEATEQRQEKAPDEAPAATNGHGDHETGEHAVAHAEQLPAIPRATPRQAPRRPAAQPLRAPQRSATVPHLPRPSASSPLRSRTPPARPRGRTAAPPPRRGGPGTGVIAGGLVGLVVLVVAALFVTGVIGGGDGGGAQPTQSGSGSPPATSTPKPAASSPAARGAATVVVLNGTTVDGLAAGEKAKLEQAGYRDVQTTTSQNQAEQRSTVAYASGERRQAMDVGKVLGITTVQPLDSDTQALANNSFAKPVQADVVVIAGADQAP